MRSPSSIEELLSPVFLAEVLDHLSPSCKTNSRHEPSKFYQILFSIVAGWGNEKQLGSEQLIWHVPFIGLDNQTVVVNTYRAW